MAQTILNPDQELILKVLAHEKLFVKNFYLTGGTALSEYYLQHRISEDLDFFSEREIDKIWLNTIAKKIKEEIKFEDKDIEESFNRNLVYFKTLKGIIKTEFTYYPFQQIETPKIIEGIKVDSFTDIAANKFFTVYQKPTARHFIDLYLILNLKHYSWDQLEKFARIKFDTVIDPIQLGSQLIKSETVKDLPQMVIELEEKKWRRYFIEKAKALRNKLD